MSDKNRYRVVNPSDPGPTPTLLPDLRQARLLAAAETLQEAEALCGEFPGRVVIYDVLRDRLITPEASQ